MKLPRRKFLHLAAGAAALPAISRLAWAQAYPTQPVRIIVGVAPGGPTDILARLLAQWLSERLGQQFLVENRPGAGTNIATEAVVRAPADGYTLLFVGPASAINATLYDKLSFNFLRDIAPVAGFLRGPTVLVVNPSVPAKSVPELIAYAKANPGKLNLASAGNGTGPHMFGELFKLMAGVDMVHVPYRSDVLAEPRSISVPIVSRSASHYVKMLTDQANAGISRDGYAAYGAIQVVGEPSDTVFSGLERGRSIVGWGSAFLPTVARCKRTHPSLSAVNFDSCSTG